MKYDVIIIGAGVAGLFAALRLGQKNQKVLLIEKNNEAGKKLLLTGSGQCNITQSKNIEKFSKHYGNNYKYIRPSLSNFNNKDVISFFEDNNLEVDILKSGKVFPKSRKAKDVRDLLVNKCCENNVIINFNEKANDLYKLDNGYQITTNKEKYLCHKLIIATGGMSYPKTGSTGDGYILAEKVNQPIITPKAGLTPVQIKNFTLSHLSGISFSQIPLEIWRNNKKLTEVKGDLLITHKGLSGPVILNSSRWIQEGDVLKVNFLNNITSHQLEQSILQYAKENGSLQIQTTLKDYNIPKRLLETILQDLNIDKTAQCSQLKKDKRKLLTNALTNYKLRVSKLSGLHIAMVTAGGTDMNKINPTTMESRINKNLYFIGEVVDIDGDTGGYNIQAALSMAETCKNSILTDFDLL